MNSAASTSSGGGGGGGNSSEISSEDLNRKTSSWTLGCDNLLLNKLESISKNLVESSSEILKECSSLSKDVTLAQAKLGNVTNQFLMLSNSQFVENRVQEFQEIAGASNLETVDKTTTKIPEKTKAEKEADLIAKMKEAIRLGVAATDQHTNSLVGNPSATTLPLPYLIGSPKYFSNRYVGLIDDEFRLSQGATPPSSTRQENPAVVSNNQTLPTEPEPPDPVQKKPNVLNNIPSIPSQTVEKQNLPYDNQGHSAVEQPVILPPRKPIVKQEDKYFRKSFEPPPIPPADSEDDSDDDFKPISRGSGAGGLFADDDDDDLFNDSSLFPSNKVTNSNPFFNNNAFINPVIRPVAVSPPPITNDREDISDNKKSHISPPTATGIQPAGSKDQHLSQKATIPVRDISSTNNPVVTDIASTTTTTKPKIPPGAVPIFGTLPHSEIPRLKKTRETTTSPSQSVADEKPEVGSNTITGFSSDKSSSSVVGTNEDRGGDTASQSSLTSKGMTSSSQGSLADVSKRRSPNPGKDIFNDEESDDDFLFNPTGSKKSSSNSLFSNNSKDNFLSSTLSVPKKSKISGKPSSVRVKSSIFDESDSEDDLFSSASSSTSSKPYQPIVFPSTSIKKSSFTNRGLFDDDSDGDLFSDLVATPTHENQSSRTNDQVDNNTSEYLNNGKNYSNQPPEIKYNSDKKSKAKTTEGKMDSGSNINDQSESVAESSNPISTSTNATDSSAEIPVNTTKMESTTANNNNNLATPTSPSKISQIKEQLAAEKAKEMEKADIKKSQENKKLSDSKINVKKLALDLKIDPLAMRPGAKPRKSQSAEENQSPSKEEPSPCDKDISLPEGAGSPEEQPAKCQLTDSTTTDVTDDEPKSKPNVKKLAMGLNINPLALRPDFKQKRQKSVETPENEPSSPVSPKTASSLTIDESSIISKDQTAEESSSTEPIPSKRPSVKNLAEGFKINPLALLPGMKQKSVETPEGDEPSSADFKTKTPEADNKLEEFANTLSKNEETAETSKNTEAEEPLPKRPSVKKLAQGLNINPLAMRPDFKPRQRSSESETPTPTSESKSFSEDFEGINKNRISKEPSMEEEGIVDVLRSASLSRDSSKESVPSDGDPEKMPRRLLPSLVKTRVKMSIKRKPPSKKLRQSYIQQSSQEEVASTDENMMESEDAHDGKDDTDKQTPESITQETIDKSALAPESPSVEPSDEGIKEEPVVKNTVEDNIKDDDLVAVENETPSTLIASPPPPPLHMHEPPPPPDLWEEDSDSDDIFASSTLMKPKTAKLQKPVAVEDIFNMSKDNRPNSADDEMPKEKRLSVSVFQGSETASEKRRNTLPDTSSTVENVPKQQDDSISTIEPERRNSKEVTPPIENLKPKSGGLFVDDDNPESDDDLFASSKSLPKHNKKESCSIGNNIAAIGDEKEQSSTSKPPQNHSDTKHKVKNSKTGLFDSDSEDDLFKTEGNTLKKPSKPSLTNNFPPAEEKSKKPMPAKKQTSAANKSIFSDSSDDDLFAPKAK